jgi:hypothetical protein
VRFLVSVLGTDSLVVAAASCSSYSWSVSVELPSTPPEVTTAVAFSPDVKLEPNFASSHAMKYPSNDRRLASSASLGGQTV